MNRMKTLRITLPFMLVLACFIAYQYGYVRVQTARASLKEELEMKTRTLTQHASLLSGKPQLEKQFSDLKNKRQAKNEKLIVGMTPSLSAAELQESLEEIVTSNGGRISSERVGQTEDLGTFKVVTVSIDAVLPDTGALSDVLYAIETGTPDLILKKLDVRNRTHRRSTRRTARSRDSSKAPEETKPVVTSKLVVKMDVAALTQE